ncbi:unnamed protein product, partial [Polarella glacialis]
VGLGKSDSAVSASASGLECSASASGRHSEGSSHRALPPLVGGASLPLSTEGEPVVTRTSLLRGSREKKAKERQLSQSSDVPDAVSTRVSTPAELSQE